MFKNLFKILWARQEPYKKVPGNDPLDKFVRASTQHDEPQQKWILPTITQEEVGSMIANIRSLIPKDRDDAIRLAEDFRQRFRLRLFTCFPRVHLLLTAYDQPPCDWGIDFAGGKVSLVYKPSLLEDLANAENAMRVASEGEDSNILTAAYYALEIAKGRLIRVISYNENFAFVTSGTGPHSALESFLTKPWGKEYDGNGNLLFRSLTSEQRLKVREFFPNRKLIFTSVLALVTQDLIAEARKPKGPPSQLH